MTAPSLVLGIETSCDECAAAVVEDGRIVRSSVVASQADLHEAYGGVFPEMASRQHIRDIRPVIRRALDEAGAPLSALAGIAVTRGPGLAGSLQVGVNAAKGLCLATGRPLVGVNHLAGHLYSHWLRPATDDGVGRSDGAWPGDPPFPLILLTVSGGHTELVLARGHGDYRLLGQTLDDAAGEALDKAARMLGLPYPGGPSVQAAAAGGDEAAFGFPVALTAGALDFSFSGLKTALLRRVERLQRAGGELPLADLAASYQAAVVRALVDGARRALAAHPEARALLLAGGVAANGPLRRALAAAIDAELRVAAPEHCTDNAAMIAAAGHFDMARGLRHGLDLEVDPNLRLAMP